MDIKIADKKSTKKFQDIEYYSHFEYEGKVYIRLIVASCCAAKNIRTKEYRYDLWDKDVYPLKIQSVVFERE